MVPSKHPGPFVVALTGGIAAGKNAVSDRFTELGVPVVDTDLIAHELVEPGQPLLEKVIKVFGPELLDARGRLRRRRLRRMVFADHALRSRLEALLHPAILDETLRRITVLDSAYCIVVIPLLAEAGRKSWIERVLVVDVDPEVQIDRVMRRDRVSRAEAVLALESQAGRGQRLAIADDVIDNSGALSDLDPQVETLHAKYLSFATQ